ncbi:MAG: hypothetical protein IPM25_05245 [Chloracidobacterium sp.]|nr:hypothetical protein [Chloracidobacterium sp.]
MSEQRKPEDEIVAGLAISSNELAALIADALVDGGVVREADRARCEGITAEEIWIRKQLVDAAPRDGV